MVLRSRNLPRGGLHALRPPPWIPAFAGMTVLWVLSALPSNGDFDGLDSGSESASGEASRLLKSPSQFPQSVNRRCVSRYRKNGAPISVVMMPMGVSSPGRTMRATMSQPQRKLAERDDSGSWGTVRGLRPSISVSKSCFHFCDHLVRHVQSR